MNNQEHLDRWVRRGLIIPDEGRALRYLSHISYYRFSAYAIPFYEPNEEDHKFKAGTSFDDVLSLYIFDRELRLHIMDAIERIEVSVRASICNHMSITHDKNPFWYLEKKHFKAEYDHNRLISKLEDEIESERNRYDKDVRQLDKRTNITPEQKATLLDKIKKETFLRHYFCSYDEPQLPPCWMMVEMLAWGDLSFLYSGLNKVSEQKAIAKNLGSNAELLPSWLKAFNTIRNHCAHHNRLWNREFGVSLKIPKQKAQGFSGVKWLENTPVLVNQIRYEKRLYPVLAAVQSLLYTISPSSSWAKKLKKLLTEFPQASLANMGIPDDWDKDPFWGECLRITD